MSPLTVECARARQLLDERLEGALPPEHEGELQSHLSSCPGCLQAQTELDTAMSALAALSPADLQRLRGPLQEPDLDTGSLVTGALVVGLIVGLLLLVAFLFTQNKAKPTPTPPPVVLRAPGFQFSAESVGGEVGLEPDSAVEDLYDPEPDPEPETEAAPLVVAQAPAPAPAPVAVAKKPAPVAPKPKVAQPPQPKKPAPVAPKPDPLPKDVQTLLARLQLSDGLRYRSTTFYFLRDPAGRDRLSSSRSQGLASVSEAKPRDPKLVRVRPPGGRNLAYVLAGEILEAPFGLRVVTTTLRLRSRMAVPVEPVRYDPLGRRPKPILKGPVLLPSYARLALIRGAQPGPVALFLGALSDPRFKEIDRVRIELGEVEAEAKELERRIRAIVGDTRGLRGVGVSVDGQARSLDLFGSARVLRTSLGTILRTALLEARLGRPYDQDNKLDPRPTSIQRGITDSKPAHRDLLKGLALATETPLLVKPRREIDKRFDWRPEDGSGGVVLLQGERIVHAVAAFPATRNLATRKP